MQIVIFCIDRRTKKIEEKLSAYTSKNDWLLLAQGIWVHNKWQPWFVDIKMKSRFVQSFYLIIKCWFDGEACTLNAWKWSSQQPWTLSIDILIKEPWTLILLASKGTSAKRNKILLSNEKIKWFQFSCLYIIYWLLFIETN